MSEEMPLAYLNIHGMKFLLKMPHSSKVIIYKGEKEEDGLWFECDISMTDIFLSALDYNPKKIEKVILNAISYTLTSEVKIDEREI